MRRVLPLCIILALCGVLPAAAQQATMKLGVFDAATVFDRSQHGQALKSEVERLRDLRLKEMNDKQQELESLQEEMRNKELTFNDDKRAEMMQRIEKLQIELRRMNDDATREIQAEFGRAQQKLQTELLSVVDAVGQEGQFTLIVETGFALYSAPAVDITGLVLQKFDEMIQTACAVKP